MGDSKTKSARLSAIASIIRREHVGSQEELIGLLKEMGYDLTQATLSRDLKELQVVKVHTASGYRYAINNATSSSLGHGANIHRAGSVALSADVSDNLAVVKTLPGFAPAVATTIDSTFPSDVIVGTIAGDDTVMVILRSPESYPAFFSQLSATFPSIQDQTNTEI